MSNILLISHLIITVLLILVVLFQKSEGGGLGMGSSDNQGFGTGATSSNPLSRLTWILTGLFFAIAILLTIISLNEGRNSSVFQKQIIENETNEEDQSPKLPDLNNFKKDSGVLTPPSE